MARAQRLAAYVAALALAACTPGGVATNGSSSTGAGVTIVKVSLAAFPPSQTPAGLSGAFSPATTTLGVGSTLQFVNIDNAQHTATAIPGATSFPAGSPFDASAAGNPTGTILSSAWTSGTLQPGAASQVITVDKPGTYLFGCFFHYGAPMRGEIVAF